MCVSVCVVCVARAPPFSCAELEHATFVGVCVCDLRCPCSIHHFRAQANELEYATKYYAAILARATGKDLATCQKDYLSRKKWVGLDVLGMGRDWVGMGLWVRVWFWKEVQKCSSRDFILSSP